MARWAPTAAGAAMLLLVWAAAARAAELIRYAEPDGTIRVAQVQSVQKDQEEEFQAVIFLSGRKRTLRIPSRRVVEFQRGDPDAVNQWSKKLYKGLQLFATGRYATVEKVPGAEETFLRIVYTRERGTPGQEKSERVSPYHNMYALYYLIKTRYRMGLAGSKKKLEQALADVEQFKKRSDARFEKEIPWQVPAEGGLREGRVYGWGSSRLLPEVMLYEARIQKALGNKTQALELYAALVDRIKKKNLSPMLLGTAAMEKAELEAEGQPSDRREGIFRQVGTTLASLAGVQPDAYGREVLTRASHRALLRGADLLLQSAVEGKVSYDVPLQRYRQLKEGEGHRDPELYAGAQTGIGVCLVRKGEGESAYHALLEVVTGGGARAPGQLERALYYLGLAARRFAQEIESGGGRGDFLRAEADRWWSDLRQRFPGSEWAKKAQGS